MSMFSKFLSVISLYPKILLNPKNHVFATVKIFFAKNNHNEFCPDVLFFVTKNVELKASK